MEKTPTKNAPDGANLDEKPGSVMDVGESYTAEEERAVLRKIDLTILPMMCVVFFLQYLDKQSLSYASVRSMQLTTSSSRLMTSLLIKVADFRPNHGFEYDQPAVFLVYFHILCWPASSRIPFCVLDEQTASYQIRRRHSGRLGCYLHVSGCSIQLRWIRRRQVSAGIR